MKIKDYGREEKTLGSNGTAIWLLEMSIPDLGKESRKVDLAEVKMCIVEVNKKRPSSSWRWLQQKCRLL